MIKKLKVGQQGFALVLDHFGSDQPESFIGGWMILRMSRDGLLFEHEFGGWNWGTQGYVVGLAMEFSK